MKTIDKYLTEKRITSKIKDLKPLIQKPSTSKYNIDGVNVQTTHTGKLLIFEYPAKEAMITYNLIQTCDELKKKYTQIGLRSNKDMEFIVKL
jgi:hypothetical protein